MAFFEQAITVLQTLVIALGAGLGIWGVINLLEGYGNDNPGAKSQGMKQLMAGAGVSISVGLAMVRVLTGISILWFLVPGYVFAISISFVVPKLFTAIAFDAGDVASGPMTATFLLPLAQGACVAVGGNIVTDAFGVVAMVAMTPLITVQMMGLVAQLRTRKARTAQPAAVLATVFADLPDDAIIEL